MQAQNRSSSTQAKEAELSSEIKALQGKLESAESEKQSFEMQVEALLEYNKQAKNIEV